MAGASSVSEEFATQMQEPEFDMSLTQGLGGQELVDPHSPASLADRKRFRLVMHMHTHTNKRK